MLVLYGCSDDGGGGTSGTDDSGADGSSVTDGASHVDSGHPVDAGGTHDGSATDATVPDSGTVPDSSVPDTSVPDTSVSDTGTDTGAVDSGHDAGAVDSGHDAGAADTGTDTGAVDSGTDTGAIVDSGIDTGIVDAGVDTSVPDAAPTTYSVGGTLSGLAGGDSVSIQDNGGDTLVLNANAAFTFGTKLAAGATYAVTVKTQPGAPAQTCSVTSGSGTVGAANVTNVAVTCSTNAYTVGGTVSGLAGGAVVSLSNGVDTINVGANGSFTFPTAVNSGATYAASIATQAALETCTLTGGSGTVGSAAVGSISVSCTETNPGSLAYYFGFDGDALDHSGNGHDGEVHGATLDTDRFGNANSAYNFDGASWIQADGSSLPIGGVDRTITAWFRPNVDNYNWGVVYWGNGDCNGLMFGLGAQSASLTTFWGGCMDAVSSYYMPVGVWSFAAIRYISATNTIRVTMNGQTTDYPGYYPNTQPSNLWIGGETTYNSNTGFRSYTNGALDSIRIFNRALSDAELNAVYTTMP